MNTKQWAVLFVAMLSFDYATATFFFGGYKGPKTYAKEDEGYYGWSRGCRCNKDLTYTLDNTLKTCRGHLGRYNRGFPIKDQSLEEYEFRDGHVRGLHKFERRGPYRCSLSREYVRVIFSIGFVEILIHYTVSLVEDILTGFLGGIGSLIGHILGNVSDLLFRIILPDVYVTVVLHHRFGGNQGFQLEGLYLNSIEKISFQNKKFRKHEDSFGSYFRPVCDHVLRGVIKEKMGTVFTKHFNSVKAEKEHFYYESNSGKKYGYDKETYDSESYDEDSRDYYDDDSYE